MIGANDTAREYAAAMYALAMEDADAAGKPEKVDEYLSRSEEIRGIVRDFPEWIDMLASPCIRIDERRKAVDEVLLVGKNNDNTGMYENFASLLKLLCDHDEAKLLDRCLILHAEHGGGNNSTFTVRVTSSSGTDTYSAIAAAVSSLKGPRHGGANLRVVKQFEEIKENVKDWKDEGEVRDYLCRILDGAAGDGSGLIYGMGHAIYTKSDPRAVALKHAARPLAEKKGMSDEMGLIELVEKLTPEVFAEKKGSDKPMCANVDMYSGFVYKMLGLPKSLYTPLFATARIVGWMAHRLEEVTTGGKIIRPAYKPLAKATTYTNIDERM